MESFLFFVCWAVIVLMVLLTLAIGVSGTHKRPDRTKVRIQRELDRAWRDK